MIKKLLITLLFFGFSFGQELNPHFIGTWKVIGKEQSFIFLKNGHGYFNFILDDESKSYNLKWSVIESNSNTSDFDGTLILEQLNKDTRQIYSYSTLSKQFVKDSNLVEEFFEKFNFTYSGGELLYMTDSINKSFRDGDLIILEKY
jgi:hypothetical protein